MIGKMKKYAVPVREEVRLIQFRTVYVEAANEGQAAAMALENMEYCSGTPTYPQDGGREERRHICGEVSSFEG